MEADSFANSPDNSIDYAVMEKISEEASLQGALVKLDVGWSDIGSWSSVWDIKDKDGDSNAIEGDVISIDTHNSIIHADHKLVATVGCNNLIVIETSDAVLVLIGIMHRILKKLLKLLSERTGKKVCCIEKCFVPGEVMRDWMLGQIFKLRD